MAEQVAGRRQADSRQAAAAVARWCRWQAVVRSGRRYRQVVAAGRRRRSMAAGPAGMRAGSRQAVQAVTNPGGSAGVYVQAGGSGGR